MAVDAYITLAVIFIAFILFATEYLAVDHVALGIIAVLTLTGVLSPAEGVAGFSNSAVITIAAMFVLSDALIKTGIIESVGPLFEKLLVRGYRRSILGLSLVVGSVSGFVNNTPVVATFIPIVSQASRNSGKKISKYLIPLSYGAILGGTCTLIGTSTNLLVDGIARDGGLEGFDMFSFLPLGLVFFGVGVLYMVAVGHYALPNREPIGEMGDAEELQDYLTEIRVLQAGGDSEEKEEWTIGKICKNGNSDRGVEVRQVLRDDKVHRSPGPDFPLQEGDVMLVKGNLGQLKTIIRSEYLEMTTRLDDRKFPEEETRVVEIVLLPTSRLIGKKLGDLDFFDRYHARVLAIRQRGKKKFSQLKRTRLEAGDVLLLQTSESGYQSLYKTERRRQAPFLFLSESGIEKVRRRELLLVSLIILGVIVLASLNIVPIMTGALAGVFLLVILRIISMDQAYQAIDWKVIILLAGALSLGSAMNASGLSEQIARLIENQIATRYGPVAVIAAVYLSTSLCTEVMSNNAAAALLAPIAISVASSLGLDHTPFLMAVTFAGSASFMTPIGYQTNTMVYSAGNYRFGDFFKIGLPLDLILWIIASLLIPVFYPF